MKYTNVLQIKILLLLVNLVFIANCDGQTTEHFDIPINGKLVYVEGLQGEGWLTANPFGELVLLDGAEQKRHVLTWDGYFYAHPNLTPDGKSLIFESKRSRNIGLVGLSAESDLYRMDLETREIIGINDELSDLIGEPVGNRISYPSLSPTGNKLSFIRFKDNDFHLSYIDFQGRQIIDIMKDHTKRPIGSSVMSWSPNEDFIIYTMSDRFDTYVVLVKLEEKESKIIENEITADTLNTGVLSCMSGNWKNEAEFIYSCSKAGLGYRQIYSYNVDSEISTKLLKLKNSAFPDAITELIVSRDGNQLIIISGPRDDFRSDIHRMEINTQQIIPITSSGTIKQWLRWYEDM